MGTWVTSYHFTDNNGKRAECRVHWGEALGFPLVVDRSEALAVALAAISSAFLQRFEILRRINRTPDAPAAPDADLAANLLLFYGNSTSAATLRVPSPRPLSVDLVGPYRNVRLVLAAPDVSPLLAALGGKLDGTLTPGGTDWPMPLLAGGFTRYRGPE